MATRDLCKICHEILPKKDRRTIFSNTFGVFNELCEVLGYIPRRDDASSIYVCRPCFKKLHRIRRLEELKNEKFKIIKLLKTKFTNQQCVHPSRVPIYVASETNMHGKSRAESQSEICPKLKVQEGCTSTEVTNTMNTTIKVEPAENIELWELQNLNQRIHALSKKTDTFSKNRTANLKRLEEQRNCCETEIEAFRKDINNFLDKIEQNFFSEISILEKEHRTSIENVIAELDSLSKTVESLKTTFQDLKNCATNNDLIQELKYNLSKCEAAMYSTLNNEKGAREINLSISISPELQILSTQFESLGEVFITSSPVDLQVDDVKPDVEMLETNKNLSDEQMETCTVSNETEEKEGRVRMLFQPALCRESVKEDPDTDFLKDTQSDEEFSSIDETDMPTKEQRQPCLIIVKQEPTDCIQNEETKKPENVQQLTNTTNTTAAKNQESIQNMPTIEHRRPSLFVVKQEPVDINCIQNERTEEKEYFQPHIFTNNTKSAVNQESIQSIIPTSKPIMNTVSPSFIRPALKLPIQLRLTLVNNVPTLVPICPETQMQLPHSQQQVVFGSNQSIQQLPVTFQNSNSSNSNKASSVLQSNIMQMPIIQQRSNSCKNVQLKKLAPKDPKLVVEKEWSVTKQNYTTKKLSNPKLDFEKEWAVTKKNYTAKKLTNPKLDFEKEWSVTKQNTTTKKLSNQKLVIEKEMSVTKQNCITDNYSEVSASPAPEEMYVVNDEGLVQQRFQQNEQIPTVKELLSELQNNSSAENLSNPDVDQTGVKDTRFQRITAEKLNELQEGIEEARSTKRNTKWGVKMFQAWSLETTGSEVDFHTISKEDLNEKLKYFYAETKPLKRTCRTAMKSYQSAIYKKNTMKNVRAALNRHLQNINRDFDIVRGSAFKESNALLYTKMKLLAKNGLLPPTKHKVVIDTEDLRLINNYVYQTNFDSVSLRFRVWYCIAIHFVSLPIDFQHQLTMNSFGFNRDKEGKEYAYIQQVPLAPDKLSSSVKNGVASCEEVMYASPGKGFCPVAALRLMIMKTDPSATSLFNRRQTERRDDSPEFWYTNQCVGKRSFSQFMSDICKQANCKLYTAGCLRATALRARTDPDLGHIMYNTR